MKKKTIALALIVLMVLGVTYVYAQGPGFGRGHGRISSPEQWDPGKGLSLTPEQKAKFKELRRKFTEETAQLRGALLTKRLELQSLWTDPKADPKAIMDKEKELRDLQNQMRDKVVQNRLEARKLLTPEQIAQFGLDQGMGPKFGRGRMMGHGRGMDYGYGACY